MFVIKTLQTILLFEYLVFFKITRNNIYPVITYHFLYIFNCFIITSHLKHEHTFKQIRKFIIFHRLLISQRIWNIQKHAFGFQTRSVGKMPSGGCRRRVTPFSPPPITELNTPQAWKRHTYSGKLQTRKGWRECVLTRRGEIWCICCFSIGYSSIIYVFCFFFAKLRSGLNCIMYSDYLNDAQNNM